MAKPNREHYHVWVLARGGRIFYRLRRGFWSGQAASQWARRHYPGREVTVRKCDDPACAPPL